MSKVSRLAKHILSTKYYAKGETSPEHVFKRVANVVSIPDVIERLVKERKIRDKIIHPGAYDIKSIFRFYRKAFENTISREYKELNLNELGLYFTDQEIKDIWKEEAKKYYDAICNLDLMPATPTLMNSATSTHMLSSCFAISIPDSMEGIFESVKEVAIISQKGGGVGLDLSNLRPKGSLVKTTGGISSGPISFMKVFNETGNQVEQGGARRAALLAGLRVDHPDIMDFISCKKTEGNLTNFNISVFVTDEFMEALEADSTIELKHPACENTKTIKASEIWEKLIEHAHKNGEPGIVFIDQLQRDDMIPDKYGKLIVNPCQPKHALILDDDRLRRIDDRANTWKSWKTGYQPVIRLTCNNGLKIECTPDHKIQLNNGEFVEAKNSLRRTIKWGLGKRKVEHIIEDQVIRGFLFGDGFICGNKHGVSVRLNSENEKDIVSLLEKYGFWQQENGAYYANYKKLEDKIGDLSFLNYHTYERDLPDDILYGNSEIVASFLKGLYSANGSCSVVGIISLKGTCLSMIEKVQVLLASFGINSWRCTNKPQKISWSNGEYISKESYNLQIARTNGIKFKNKIGFVHQYKMDKILASNNTYNTQLAVIDIEELGEKEVWDYQMNEGPDYNFCQGAILKNCSELALKSYESCNLASINLANCINKMELADYVNKPEFDIEKFRSLVRLGVRFLDNVVTINEYPLKKIEEINLQTRKIGLGSMGLADLFLKLKVEYGSDESLYWVNNIYSEMYKIAREESVKLADIRGPAPVFESGGTAYRNAGLLTVPPTGTVSIIADCSSGIEPNYQWEYTRKDSYGEHEVTHFIKEKFGNKLPPYAKTALEIDPEKHVLVQAAVQKYIDSAISKTTNLPKEATIEGVDKTMRLAYEKGCKSITVYRQGSRKQEVLSKKFDKNEQLEQKVKADNLVKLEPRDRPRVLFGATYQVLTSVGKCYITINEDEDGTREAFINVSKAGSELSSHVASEGRLISNSLQYRVPIKSIINHLKGQKSTPVWEFGLSIKSIPDAIAFALEDYLKNYEGFSEYILDSSGEVISQSKTGEEEILGELCPECGEALYYEGGCSTCKSCGYTACGG